MAQPNRLPPDAPHGFGGSAIRRDKPLSFKLNGRVIEGFEGDTALTAALANGIDTAGLRDGHPVTLDALSAPIVAPRSEPKLLMPLDRVPALNGLDLVVASAGGEKTGLLTRLFGGSTAPNSLGDKLDDAPPAPWLDAAPEATLEADTLVIGGGLAGLSAAQSGSGKTILVERRSWLGGDARYYGTTGEEEAPEAATARLTTGLHAEVLLHTEVFALSGTTARAHQVLVENGKLSARVVAITANRVVLATGAFERLPLFAGNRSPGVVGLVAAYNRADRFGIWPGKRAIVSTPSGHGYRLALHAHDAGITLQRIVDSRLGPHSRFIDFCKASGVSFTNGLVPRSATPHGKGHSGLSVSFAVAIEDIRQDTGLTETDQLIAGGGGQPELTLWLQAGGTTHWVSNRLEATGTLPHIALAGSAAGYRGLTACIASGRAAVSSKPIAIDDPEIEAIYESPDGATPVAPEPEAHTQLDHRSGTPRPTHPGQFAPTRPLTLGDVAAAVQIGAIPPGIAGQVASERVLSSGDLAHTGWRVPVSPAPTEVPAWLTGRFGLKPQPCVVTSADARYFERGSLIFANSATTDPAKAVGAIIGPNPGGGVGGLALIEREASKGEARLFVRDSGSVVPIERLEKR